MIAMNIILHGNRSDRIWPDLHKRNVVHLANNAPPIQVAVRLTRGRPSVAFRLDLPDGRTVIAETSASLFVLAAKTIWAKYPNLFDDEKGET